LFRDNREEGWCHGKHVKLWPQPWSAGQGKYHPGNRLVFHHALPLAGLDKKTEWWPIVVVALNPQKQMEHAKYDEGFASEEEDCGFAKRDQEGGDRKNDDHFDQLIKEQDTGEVDILEQESNSAAIVESLGTSRHLSSGGVSLAQGLERRKNEACDTDLA
jgi:hypothetical protein